MKRQDMTIVVDFPPIYDEIAAVFRIYDRRDVVFAWGDRIYNPYELVIPTEILAHEAVHGGRQGSLEAGIREWWKRYMEDRAFRFAEEVHAHRAEYLWLMQNAPRGRRRSALKLVASKLASPLYGNMATASDARKILRSTLNG